MDSTKRGARDFRFAFKKGAKMSFLVPLFFAGAFLVAGPIVAHLIRRSTQKRVQFSDTRFMEESAPRLTKRSRIENPWLLLLRCLAVLVLCAGFARPFMHREIPVRAETNVQRQVIVVLDESASMQRRGLWEASVERVREIVASMGDSDQLALFSAGLTVTPLITSEKWRETHRLYREDLLNAAIGERSPGWGPSPIDSGIEAALDELAVMAEVSGGAPSGEIMVVSDLTEGVSIAGLAGRDWLPGTSVTLVRPTTGRRANVSLESLGWTQTSEGARAARLRIGYDGAAGDSFRLRVLDAIDKTDVANARSIPVAAGETRIVVIEIPDTVTRPILFEISGDLEPYDNSTWLLPPQPREIVLPYLGDDAADDISRARFYVSRAVNSWKDPVVNLHPMAPVFAGPLPDAPLFIVADKLDAPSIVAVRERLEAGRFALVLLKDAEMVATAAAIAGETNWSAATIERGDALLGAIDFQHPLFTPFADPRFSNFTQIRFWKPVPLQLPEETNAVVAARFDDASPAVVEVPVGEGRLIVWGGAWSTESGQWVLSSKFVPWLLGLVERATGGPPRPTVADPSDISHLTGGAPARWRPAGADSSALSDQSPVTPGVYELEQEGTIRWVALQVPPLESKNEPLSLDSWEQLGVPLEVEATVSTVGGEENKTKSGSAAVLENEQQIWRWILIAGVVILAIESAAAAWAGRHPAPLTT